MDALMYDNEKGLKIIETERGPLRPPRINP